MTKGKVLLGMSGGVDSSVAAALLLEEGYEVVGVAMQIRPILKKGKQNIDDASNAPNMVDDSERVAKKFGIPLMVIDFRNIFNKHVVDYFVSEYQNGRTPNPCIACNRFLKFGVMMEKAVSLGMDYVATGHYARKVYDEDTGRYLLVRSVDYLKDQTYFLYTLRQDQLRMTLFPIGSHTKEKVRETAAALELPVAYKPGSQEICFVEGQDYVRFIEEYTDKVSKPGFFVDSEGKKLGEHKGIINYTIGQRKGLGIALGKPVFVIDIRTGDNTVVLGSENELYSNRIIASDLNFILFEALKGEMRVTAKVRYSVKESKAVISPLAEGQVSVLFDEPQRAITPGQSVVFYKDDLVVGGGVIKSTKS